MLSEFSVKTWLPLHTQIVAEEKRTGALRRFLVVPANRAAHWSVSYWPAGGPLRISDVDLKVIKVRFPNGAEYYISPITKDALHVFGSSIHEDALSASWFNSNSADLIHIVESIGAPIDFYLAYFWYLSGLSSHSFGEFIKDVWLNYDVDTRKSFISYIKDNIDICDNCCSNINTNINSAVFRYPVSSLLLIIRTYCLIHRYMENKSNMQFQLATIIKLARRELDMPEWAVSIAESEYEHLTDDRAKSVVLVPWSASLVDIAEKANPRDRVKLLDKAKALAKKSLGISESLGEKNHYASCVLMRICNMNKLYRDAKEWEVKAQEDGGECKGTSNKGQQKSIKLPISVKRYLRRAFE